ncbi:antibiotic biosynthesis monooxygenase [Streptomyces mashuensis]|uniref:Antibiotic biosynthesis monooxygenase n=1 Tax=Streptomyces mashuensis TaxID=33904 RepID=A0A919B7J3_9ACTN|nr:putative quinol monooxygenase [Streptomyces mashuensis]GHF59542.1 antibiotic biosynthesis monooxygenase [Streptomyces mashuensis]
MIFIVVKFTLKPECSEGWLDSVREFTEATRAEPGNVMFEWSRSVDNPHQYVLVEGFASPEAGEEHVNSEHFRTAMAWMPDHIAETPQIINVEIPGQGWSEMAELTPRG